MLENKGLMVKKNKLFRDVFYDDRDDILSKKTQKSPSFLLGISPFLNEDDGVGQ